MVVAAEVATVLGSIAGAIFLAICVFTFYRSRLGRPAPGADVLRATIADVREGGAVRLGAFGDDREDVILTVARRARVRLGGEEWQELSGEYRGRTLTLEWRARPTGLRVVAYRKTGLPLAEVGLDAATLDQARAGAAPVAALGSTFKVEELGDAIREGATPKDSLAVRTWALYDEEKRQYVRVERVGEQPPTASHGVPVAADAVEVVRLKG